MSEPVANNLLKEKSPYLLQHTYNPVNWYPWSGEAFSLAKKQNKPVMLSVGYATCHWCHVMEHESFEDSETAKLLNENFISVKVDREERPDIDALYMKYVIETTGHGGWPMTVFMTGDGEPFFGGTYFPKERRYGMPSFRDVLEQIAQGWKTQPHNIREAATSASAFLRKNDSQLSVNVTTESPFEGFRRDWSRVTDSLARGFDSEYGGFSQAPKFPRPSQLSLMLRMYRIDGDLQKLEQLTTTLKSICAGGMYDQLGGGIHRYSTDKQWRIPHFEKMLYDQAGFLSVLAEYVAMTGDEYFSMKMTQTFDYLQSHMRDLSGAYYSAEDADSLDASGVKKEGAYYLWTEAEIKQVLGDGKIASDFCQLYGVQSQGNAISDPHNEFAGLNVLYEAKDQILDTHSDQARSLLQKRSQRPRPFLDDKILSDWNSLLMSALCKCYFATHESKYLEAALKAQQAIEKLMCDEKGLLRYHRYRDGQAAVDAMLMDVASYADALIELYQATLEPRFLDKAHQHSKLIMDKFYDDETNDFYMRDRASASDLIHTPKDYYDGATASGNSMALLSLSKMILLVEDAQLEETVERARVRAWARSNGTPQAYPTALEALLYSHENKGVLQLALTTKSTESQSVAEQIHLRFIDNEIMMLKNESISQATDSGWALTRCRRGVCSMPVDDKALLAHWLKDGSNANENR